MNESFPSSTGTGSSVGNKLFPQHFPNFGLINPKDIPQPPPRSVGVHSMTMSASSNESHSHQPRAPFPQNQNLTMVPVQPNAVPVQMSGLLSPASALEHYRLTQLYQYAIAADRLRCPPGSFLPPIPPGLRPELAPLFYGSYCRLDPRLAGLCRPPEEPKPQHSYIGLIAMAILSSADKKLVLSDIYQYILDNYPYFRTRGPGWRNSIRHNLSLNDCFIKAGRSANGKGHYWAIHPANMEDFTKGDFRRRKAQRKVRRHMGLAVDDEDSPSPPPASPPPNWHHPHHAMQHAASHLPHAVSLAANSPNSGLELPVALFGLGGGMGRKTPPVHGHPGNHPILNNRKRLFDVASLLAPEKGELVGAISPSSKSDDHDHDIDHNLSSPSPPSSMVNSKKFRKSEDSEDEEDEPIIEVAEDGDNDNEKSGAEDRGPDSSSRSRHEHGVDNEHENDEVSSSLENSHSQFRGQDGTSSNDEEEIYTHNTHRNLIPNRSSGNSNNERRISPSSVSGGGGGGNNNSSNNPLFPFEMSANHPNHGGQHSHMEFLGTQHLFNQGPHGQHLQFNPNHYPLLQHNPSLASLMILSRYRELASNVGNPKRSPQ